MTLPTTTLKISYWRKRPWNWSDSDWTLKICTYSNSCRFENQFEIHSKIDNYINNQKYKTSKSNFSKAWKENIDNMLEIMIQTSLLLILNIIIKRVGTRCSNIYATKHLATIRLKIFNDTSVHFVSVEPTESSYMSTFGPFQNIMYQNRLLEPITSFERKPFVLYKTNIYASRRKLIFK